MARAVQHTEELDRILRLPWRDWTDHGEALARALTQHLRAPGGTQELRPFQAAMISEIYEYGGAFGQGPVGCGKTLITALTPLVLSLLPNPPQRYWLVVPAALRQKTYAEIQGYAKHWRVPRVRIGVSEEPNVVSIVSYNEISVKAGMSRLEWGRPDCLMFDEAHSIKNGDAAVTKKFDRYIKTRRKGGLPLWTMLLSGTMAKRSLHDFRHLLWYARPDAVPVPMRWYDFRDWAWALDERVDERERLEPGALMIFAQEVDREPEESDLLYARRGVQKRIFSTPGILTSKSAEVDCSLVVEGYEFEPSSAVDEAFERLRTVNETPDGWPMSDALSIWRHATELALGFYTYWDPRPPQIWLDARRAWYSCVREILNNESRRPHQESTTNVLNSMLEVALAVGKQPEKYPEAWAAYKHWKEVEPQFTPPKEPPVAWICDRAIQHCASWKGPGVIFTGHRPFARKLAEVTGWPWYAGGGLNARGERIEDADPNSRVIASLQANCTGRNLQFWNKALVVFPPGSGNTMEQLLGRLHRSGQEADEVVFEVLLGCTEHYRAFKQSKKDARFHRTMLDAPAKLEYCDVVVPEIVSADSWAFRGIEKEARNVD